MCLNIFLTNLYVKALLVQIRLAGCKCHISIILIIIYKKERQNEREIQRETERERMREIERDQPPSL